MANLAMPVNVLPPSEERIIEFKGLNRLAVVSEGEMSDMKNLTSDDYPILKQRKPRGRMSLPAGAIRPVQIMAIREKIAMIARMDEGYGFFYDGELISEVQDLAQSSRMVAINTKLCFFPQKTYLVIAPDGTIPSTDAYGHLDYQATISASSDNVEITDDAVEITLASVAGIKADDALDISGTLTYTGGSFEVNIAAAVDAVDASANKIFLPLNTFLELIPEGVASGIFNGSITREVPNLDHVVEWNNRLWGASSTDNTVYACKLGDPTNWKYYQSTSLDSYYAQQGTDGEWTGVAKYSNHIIFFKQDTMCRIYGTSPATFQITNTEAFGVEKGSSKSVVTINDTVFYKSKIGIMAYDGGVPYCISDKFNAEFREVVAGTEKRKYYASIHTKAGGYELMVFDIGKGLWHKEDNARFRSCATIGNKLYFIQYDDDLLTCSVNLPCSDWLLVGSENITGRVGVINSTTPYEDKNSMEWMAEFGPFDEYLEEHKIYSKLSLRIHDVQAGELILCDENGQYILTEYNQEMGMPKWLEVYISIDEGPWELVELYEPPEKNGEFIPIIPRRCDRYSVLLKGQGPCELKTLTRRVRKGSFGRL